MMLGIGERRALAEDWDLAGDMISVEALDPNPGTPISSLKDDFTDNVRDLEKWPSNYGVTSEVGGRARVECSTGFSGYQSGDIYKLDAKGVYTRIYPNALNGATSEAMTGLWWQAPLNAPAGTDLGFYINRQTGQIWFAYRVGYFDGGAVILSFDPAVHVWGWLHLDTDNGSHIVWETSADFVTWTVRRRMTVPDWAVKTSTGHWLMESHRETGTADFAEFDNVNVPPSGGMTLVSSSVDLRWEVRSQVSSAADLRWAVRSTVLSTADLRWSFLSSVSNAVDLRWAVYSSIASPVELAWSLRSSVSGTLDLRWAIASSVGASADLRWAVTAAVSNALDLRWTVRSVASSGTDLRWAVRSGVSTSADLRWVVRQAIAASADVRWTVDSTSLSVSSSVELLWTVRSQASNPADVRWSIRSTASNSADLRWSLRSAVSGSADLRWTVRGLAQAAVDARWTVRAVAGSSETLLWAQRSLVANSTDVRWALATPVGASAELQWAIRTLLAANASLLWAVEGEVAEELPPQVAAAVAQLTRVVRATAEPLAIRYAAPRVIAARLSEER